MATQNPIEQEGTYPLPEAQLDRFFFKLLVGVAGRSEMAEILNRTTGSVDAEVGPVLDGPAGARRTSASCACVAIADYVQDYAVRMVLATHPAGPEDGGPDGAAPRVTESGSRRRWSTSSSGSALAAARPSRWCWRPSAGRCWTGGRRSRRTTSGGWRLPALRHRLILNFEAHAEGVTADGVVQNIVQTLPLEGRGRGR